MEFVSRYENYRILFARHDSLSFPLFGRRKNRSISLDSWQLTAMNGTLINRQRGFTMANVFMARLFRFKPLGYVSWPRGRTGARQQNFLLPTSCHHQPIPIVDRHRILLDSSPIFIFMRVKISLLLTRYSSKRGSDSIFCEQWSRCEGRNVENSQHLFLFSKTPLLNHGFRIFPRIIFSVANRPTIFFRSRLVNLHPFLFPPLETISSSFECVPPPAVFLYSQSLQPRRSFFATLHPLLLRAPLPSFTSLFRHYEQFVVCPPLPSPTSPSRVLFRASLSAFVTATNASFYFSSRTFFTRDSL